MEEEFIPYEEALALEKLRFNEEVIATYPKNSRKFKLNNVKTTETVKAILYQQAFRWFRKNYNLSHDITKYENGNTIGIYKNGFVIYEEDGVDSYEKGELICLRKLIEIKNDS